MNLLCDRVRHILDNCGLTISDLARRIGCTPSTISQWKSGETTRIRPEHLFPFADATGFEARWIGTGEGPARKQPARESDRAKLDSCYEKADERGKAVIMMVAEREAQWGGGD
jgi:transcriptional regulator with XRE-family HTH domain